MKPTFATVAIAAFVLGLAATSWADIAPPPQSEPNNAKAPAPKPETKRIMRTLLNVQPEGGERSEPKLQIPQHMVKGLRDALGTDDKSVAPANPPVAQSTGPTMVAGIFLFLAIASAGMWLIRSPFRRARKVTVAATLALLLLGATTLIARANMPAPFYPLWSRLQTNLSEGKATTGYMQIEIVPDGNYITLVLPVSSRPAAAIKPPSGGKPPTNTAPRKD